MREWYYLAQSSVRSDKNRITLPHILHEEYNLFSEEKVKGNDKNDHLYWRLSEDDVLSISSRGASIAKLDEYITTKVKFKDYSYIATIPAEFFRDSNSDLAREQRLGYDEVVHFIATEEMVEGEVQSVYVAKTDQVPRLVPGPNAWKDKDDNLERLSELRTFEELKPLVPPQLLGKDTDSLNTDSLRFRYSVEHTYHPGKGGFVEVQSAAPIRLRARWFRWESGYEMSRGKSRPASYSVIESRFEIVDVEERVLRQIGETQRFVLEQNESTEEWEKVEDRGELDHIPKAMIRGLGEDNWAINS